jgi:hypothetical protein
MSDYLSERIWHDSGDSGNTQYRGYESSSTATTQNKTAEEEAQIGKHITMIAVLFFLFFSSLSFFLHAS